MKGTPSFRSCWYRNDERQNNRMQRTAQGFGNGRLVSAAADPERWADQER